MNEYEVQILKVVDGDTVDVDIDLGFGITLRDERVRIMGIDTPESRTSDLVEKKFGLASKERLKELLEENSILITMDDKKGEDMRGKFGRILGDFRTIDGRKVSDVMIEEGYAVQYFGQNKELVREEHMKNRERLLLEGKVQL